MKKLLRLSIIFAVTILASLSIKYFEVYADNGLIAPLFDCNSTLNGLDMGFDTAINSAKEGDTIYFYGEDLPSFTLKYGVTLIISPSDKLQINSTDNITNFGRLIFASQEFLNNDFSGLNSQKPTYSPIFLNTQILNYGTIECYLPIDGMGKIVNYGTMIEPFFILDYNNYQYSAPFYSYYFDTVKVDREIKLGSNFVGKFYYNDLTQDTICLIGDNGIFKILDGDILLNSTTQSVNYVDQVDFSQIHPTQMEIKGKAKVAATQFSLNGKTYFTKDNYLPIPYTLNITIDGNLDIEKDCKLKVLPGSSITVNDGASLNVNGEICLMPTFKFAELLKIPYPTSPSLKNNGLSVCGDLVNNGEINVLGSLVGMLSSNKLGSIINIEKTATVSRKIVDNLGNIKVETDLSLSSFSVNELVNLKAGKTYKSWSISPFTKDYVDITVDFEGVKNERIFIYQSHNGRFLEWFDGKFYANLTINIGQAVKNVQVDINGKNYFTDQNGNISCNLQIDDKNPTFKYKTTGKELNYKSYYIKEDEPIVLSDIIQSAELVEQDYTIYYHTQKEFFAQINYYGGKFEVVKIAPKNIFDSYVFQTQFEHENYSVVEKLSHTIYNYKKQLDDYKTAYNRPIAPDLLQTTVQNLFNEYQKIIKNLSGEEVEFVNSALKNYLDFSLITTLNLPKITYGETEIMAFGASVDGKTTQIKVLLSNYKYYSGDIVCKAEYFGNYRNIDYVVTVSVTNVLPIDIVYGLDNKQSAVEEPLKDLSGKILKGSLVLGDSLNLTYYTNADKLVAGYYAIWATNGNPFYNVTFANATYQITKRQVNVELQDVVVSFSQSKNILIKFRSDSPKAVIGYNVFLGDNLVASIDMFGNLSTSLGVGSYLVEPIISPNYVASFTPASLVITQDDQKYLASFGYPNGYKKEFDGAPLDLNVKFTNAKTGEEMCGDYTLTIYKDGDLASEILEVGSYVVTAEFLGESHSTNIYIVPKVIDVQIKNSSFVYGEPIENLEFVTSQPIDLGLINAKILGEEVYFSINSENYQIKNSKQTLTILPRQITVRVSGQKTYGEHDQPIKVELLSGSLASGQTLSSIISCERDVGENAQTYPITTRVIDDRYLVTVENSGYQILKRDLTLAVKNLSVFYGDKIDLQGVIVKGSLASGHTFGGIVKICCDHNFAVGTYPIYLTQLDQNYNLTYVGATLEIKKLPVVVSIFDTTNVYGDSLSVNLKTDKVLPYGESILDHIEIFGAEKNAGSYKLTAKQKQTSQNYQMEFLYQDGNHSNLTIEPKKLTLTIKPLSVDFATNYSDIINNISYTLSTDTSEDLNLEFFVEGEFGTPKAIGNYQILGKANNPNYIVTIISGELTVTKKDISIVNFNTSYTYNSEPFSVLTKECLSYQEYFDLSEYKVQIFSKKLNAYVDKIVDAGEYRITINLVSNSFNLQGQNEFVVTVNKLDLSDNFSLDFGEQDFVIIGENRPIARLLGYNFTVYSTIYFNDKVVLDINYQGEYTINLTINEDNFMANKSFNFNAYNSVSPKIQQIENLLKNMSTQNEIDNLIKAREIYNSFTQGDLLQIENKSAYRSIIDEFNKTYDEFVTKKWQSFTKNNDMIFGKSMAEMLTLVCLFLLKRRLL